MHLKIGEKVRVAHPPFTVDWVDAGEEVIGTNIKGESLILPLEILGITLKRVYQVPNMSLRTTQDAQYYYHRIVYDEENPVYCKIQLDPNFEFNGIYYLYQVLTRWKNVNDFSNLIPYDTLQAPKVLIEDAVKAVSNIVGYTIPEKKLKGTVSYIYLKKKEGGIIKLKQFPPTAKEKSTILELSEEAARTQVIFVNEDWIYIKVPIYNIIKDD